MGRLNTVSLGGSHLLTALCYLHGKAVLVAEVVGLAVRPVGPLGRGVHVRPEPGSGVVRVVPTLNTAHTLHTTRRYVMHNTENTRYETKLTLVVAPNQNEAYSPTSVTSSSLAFSQ